MESSIRNTDDLRRAVWETVHRTPVTDMHTHIYAEAFGELLLWGIDELLTYHYLVAEVFRYAPLPYEEWWNLSKREQADHVWRHVFLEHSPVSEAARGVLTTLGLLGLDPASRDLEAYRAFFAGQRVGGYLDTVFERANVSCAVMTNDPFDELEAPVWTERRQAALADPRFRPALRLDTLMGDYRAAVKKLRGLGYEVSNSCDKGDRAAIREFLTDWIGRLEPVYVAASLPSSYKNKKGTKLGKVLDECLLPVCREHNLPLAMMIGVKRQVNPRLRLAGDSVGKADIRQVERLCADYPENKFLLTMLSRENQHELCVTARKFPNLMIFGCWWFLNDPETIVEMTNLRTELLGLSYVPQHSDARVLDQLLYKWAHSRWLIGQCLQKKYEDLWRTGWRVTEAEIERDVAALFGGNFWSFLER
jgi:hypothetical protein